MSLTKTRYSNRSGSYQHVWKDYVNCVPGLDLGGKIGNEFYVLSSGAGTTGPNTPEDAVNDIDECVALCTASNNDVIWACPGHTETVTAANGIDLDVAGISLVGLGRGSSKPTITVGDGTTDTIRVNAANVLIKNIRFVSGIDSLVKMIDVNADYCTIEDCEFVGPSTLEVLSFINLATTKDYLTVRRCRFEQKADPTGTDGGADTGAIYCVDSENIIVEDCVFDGFFESACFHNRTTACKYLTWRNNTVNQQLSTGHRMVLVTGHTGVSRGVDSDFVPGLGYRMPRATADILTSAAVPVYTIAGAPVLVKALYGRVTTIIGTGTTPELKFISNPTTGTTTDLCAVLNIADDEAGSLYAIVGAPATALATSQSGGVVAGATSGQGIIVSVGAIEALCDEDVSGSIALEVWWMPLDPAGGVLAI